MKYRRHGIALVWLVLMWTAMIGLVGLSIDVAYALNARAQLQTAADAAALAGAMQLKNGSSAALGAAATVALANTAAGATVELAASGDATVGSYNAGVFASSYATPNAVKVIARRTAGSPRGPMPLFFGPLFGVPTADISATATAVARLRPSGTLMVLNSNAPMALGLSGSASITITKGTLQVNSAAAQAVNGSGSSRIFAPEIDVVGGYYFSGSAGMTGTIKTHQPVMPDPLAALPEVSYSSWPDLGSASVSSNNSRTIGPGYYSGGISASGSSTMTLRPGIYVVGGSGVQVSGSADLYARGVMIYLVGSGGMSISGNGSIAITPPDPSRDTFAGAATYAGVSVFQSRTNATSATFSGSSGVDIEGVIYLPKAAAVISGNGQSLGGQFVVDRLTLSGSGGVISGEAVIPLPTSQSYLAR